MTCAAGVTTSGQSDSVSLGSRGGLVSSRLCGLAQQAFPGQDHQKGRPGDSVPEEHCSWWQMHSPDRSRE